MPKTQTIGSYFPKTNRLIALPPIDLLMIPVWLIRCGIISRANCCLKLIFSVYYYMYDFCFRPIPRLISKYTIDDNKKRLSNIKPNNFKLFIRKVGLRWYIYRKLHIFSVLFLCLFNAFETESSEKINGLVLRIQLSSVSTCLLFKLS